MNLLENINIVDFNYQAIKEFDISKTGMNLAQFKSNDALSQMCIQLCVYGQYQLYKVDAFMLQDVNRV